MPGARDVVVHQLRQIIVYTCYFSIFQCMIMYYNISPLWSGLVGLSLLGISIYEDRFIVDQLNMPDTLLILRMWACNLPVIISNIIIYCLDRCNLMNIAEEAGPKRPGRPAHMLVTTAKTGIFLLDELFLLCAYFLWYFSVVSMFRSLVSQYRFVKQLFEENADINPDDVVSSNEPDNSPSVHSHRD